MLAERTESVQSGRLQERGRFFELDGELWYEQGFYPGYMEPLRTPRCYRRVDVFRQTIKLKILTVHGEETALFSDDAYFAVGVLTGEETYRFCPPGLGGGTYGELTIRSVGGERQESKSARVLLNIFVQDVRSELENDNGR